MESKANYTLVGICVLIMLFGLLATGLWLSTSFDNKKYNYYIVYMKESVAGLSDESLVKYNGVKVGTVSKIELSQLDPQQVKILLKIEEGTPITISTRATMITQGITGTTFLGLSSSSSSFIPLQKTPGEPYPVIPTKPSFFNRLETNIDAISRGFQRILTRENAKNLSETLANLEQVSAVIRTNSRNLDKSLELLPKMINDFKKAVVEFKIMAKNLSEAGEQVTVTMKAGKNSIDKISQQIIPPAVLLLRRLDNVSNNLEAISAQMRQNPAVLIRGNTLPKSGPGE